MKIKVQINNNCLESMPCKHDVIIGNNKLTTLSQPEIKKYLENKDLYECVYISNTKIIMGLDKKLVVEELKTPQEFVISDNDHLWQ